MLACAAVILFLLDASASINEKHWQDMIRGHAEALVSERVLKVIEGDGPIAIGVYAFSDSIEPMMRFRLLQSPADARTAANDLNRVERPFSLGTRAGLALEHAVKVMETEAPCESHNLLIDLVSDGESYDEYLAERARDRAQDLSIRINVLGVGRIAADWLNNHAKTSTGFYMQIDSMDDIIPSLQRKIVRELASSD